jgi:hypothetical protein
VGKTLQEFLNQPVLLREPTAEENELAALLNGSTVTAPVVLPQGRLPVKRRPLWWRSTPTSVLRTIRVLIFSLLCGVKKGF